ncbi:Twitching mobility protein [Gimesia maris]|jgi:twitching motility protein PilT|uniref:Twitching motility protein PilT n=1 Tax=Gimesia maris TaxID=122 RepID=A0A3D3RE33_9PLAN|nr:PilT/PilU family type 4a pilus ATPase [Gimesia maris]MAC54107.1 twitching motility protein PilT [Gimesia sp.]QDT82370.1 Twitching mobility protein [Gimesia maris]HCO26358.1 twitching motility protein PilT [Gimesia maris]|tara:strand:- start:21463 stop:22533 length:1071 start_codon:yes stop_codon:yes gene_type:complete
MEMNDLLHAAVDSNASDILLAIDAAPMFRIDGTLKKTALEPLDPVTISDLCDQVLNPQQKEILDRQKDVDFAITIPRLGRFRFNIHVQRGTYAAAIRRFSNEICSLSSLDLPPVVEELTRLKTGLILVTGQTGSGKSTTLAAMVEAINQRDAKHIITLEDPIEYQFQHGRSLIEQREIGEDCPGFASGLKHVLRQDPDVILIGELRDLDTIRVALQAAETGHLVLSSLHVSSAAGVVDRLVEVFPPEEQSQVRSHLAETLRGVITQKLLPAADGNGRVAALEIMLMNRAVQTSIRESTSHLIPGIISTSRRMGMQTMEQALKEQLLNGKVEPDIIDEHLQELKGESPKEYSQGLLA